VVKECAMVKSSMLFVYKGSVVGSRVATAASQISNVIGCLIRH
jgi:hypothetical protein